MFPISGRRERRHAHDGRPRGPLRNQRLGDVPETQEVDGDDKRRVADTGRDAGDIEKGIDPAVDACYRAIDRPLFGTVDIMKLVELERGSALIQPDDLGPELGELA